MAFLQSALVGHWEDLVRPPSPSMSELELLLRPQPGTTKGRGQQGCWGGRWHQQGFWWDLRDVAQVGLGLSTGDKGQLGNDTIEATSWWPWGTHRW